MLGLLLSSISCTLLAGEELPKVATYRLETSVEISADNGGIVVASIPIARSWQEQDVETVSKDAFRCKYKVQNIAPGAAVAIVTTSRLSAEGTASFTLVQRVTARAQPMPQMNELVAIPAKNNALKPYLVPTPGVESDDKAIVAKANEIVGGTKLAWEKAKKLAEWTRGHVKYRMCDFHGAKKAFETSDGDCEELAALFIAMCRTQGIPARTVNSPGLEDNQSLHAWAEICLARADGSVEWFPVDVGMGFFGELPAPVVALYKGEGYRFGRTGEPKHHMQFWAEGRNSVPDVTFKQSCTPETEGAAVEITKYVSAGRLRKK